MSDETAARKLRPKPVIWTVAAILVAIVAAAVTWFARFEPLTEGSEGYWPTSSTDAWMLDHTLFEADTVLIVRNEHLARLDLTYSIRNESNVSIDILDFDAGRELDTSLPCFWHPVEVSFTPASWYDDRDVVLEPPFTLGPNDEVTVHAEGRIGEEGDDPCRMSGIGWADVELPIRYTVLGISRTQHVPLDLVLALSDDPTPYLELATQQLEPPE